MIFESKAQTLANMFGKLNHSTVLPMQTVKFDAFGFNCAESILTLQNFFSKQKVIVRSSHSHEDTAKTSMAGKYLSVLNVDVMDSQAIKSAIEKVFASYGARCSGEEVLIQPMLSNVLISGVAFTCDINTGAPYYIINYSEDGATTTVTDGTGKGLKSYVLYKRAPSKAHCKSMEPIIRVLREIEDFCESDSLDVEFAVTLPGEVVIMQVRPITSWHKSSCKEVNLDGPLDKIYKKTEKLLRPHPFLLGDTNCFGVMPDWNPAEILGSRPKKLAISLYKELITDNTWAQQRSDYGYRDLTSHPLMASFCAIPYIDVRTTLNSFVPQNLNRETANKLINYYLKKLRENPAYHDKIEFEIVWSCYYLGIRKHLQTLTQHGFSNDEVIDIEQSLLDLTGKIIHPGHGIYRKDIDAVKTLTENHNKIIESDLSVIDKIYWLIEQCKSHGTLPFAGAARAGFIAVQFLRSFVECGIFTQNDYNTYMASLSTVSRQISIDHYSLNTDKMSKDAFLSEYGHIRPNTYDILSPRYDEAYDLYFSTTDVPHPHSEMKFQLCNVKEKKIQSELDRVGLPISANDIMLFIKEAIEAREQVKLIFTRSVSEILRLLQQFGKRMKIPNEDLAYLDIGIIKQLYMDLYFDNLGEILKHNILMNKAQYECAKLLKLPDLIRLPEDVYSFYAMENEPNFITTKSITGEAVSEDIVGKSLESKIVFIPSADPGYDFLFTKQIGGLITEYGGANSHMAIRCAEMAIPAIIGAGAKYNLWRQHKRLTIDCQNRKVTGIEV
ncbi:MAG: PEP-utilizing enzyme [Oscillospiraceae bacterium]|nr:PEP-utilizing enzyme [Oscillospiraceae bacterium]